MMNVRTNKIQMFSTEGTVKTKSGKKDSSALTKISGQVFCEIYSYTKK